MDPIPPHYDPTPTTGYDPRKARTTQLTAADMPTGGTKPPSSYLPNLTRDQLVDRLLTALLGALAAILVPWLVPYTRPPATLMVPAQQAKIERGEAAAVVVTEVLGFLPEAGE